jgi:hypothetical protein
MQDNLVALYRFLSTFPSLTSLRLEGFEFSDDFNHSAQSISLLTPVNIALGLPVLTAFLVVLRSTAAREVRYRAEDEKREMRWTRLTREEDFVSECWTLE